MKFVIRAAAREDILRQYRYYLLDVANEFVADRFLDAVQSAVMQVCRNPGIGVPKPMKNAGLAGLRCWMVKGFPDMRVYYVVAEDMVRVVACCTVNEISAHCSKTNNETDDRKNPAGQTRGYFAWQGSLQVQSWSAVKLDC